MHYGSKKIKKGWRNANERNEWVIHLVRFIFFGMMDVFED
jgi:hypothetical protein